MNKQKFVELLNNPGDLKEVNLKELDDLVSENPYFQAARVLEARGHRLLKQKAAGRKTASAAIYSTNRILLKKYLAGDGVDTKRPVAPPPPQKQEKPTPTPPAEIPVSQSPVIPSESTPSETVDASGSSNIDQLIYSLNKDMEELEKSRARYIEVTRKIEEEEAVEKAVKKATKNTEKAAAKAPESKKTASKTRATSTAGEKKSTSSRKTTASKTATKAAAKPKTSTSKASAAKKTTTKSGTKKASPKTTSKKSTSRTSRSSKTTKTAKKEDSDGENQHELIDQFIKKNPSFKPATEATEQQDLSEQSTALPDDIGTEYLAEIFLEQGKKDKALKIYNSLMLRFPEKKAYFAGRIKKIK